MNWHSATVPAGDLGRLLARIESVGGTVECSRPGTAGVSVTWTTR